jgi:His-Xaa-Ser system protein HxsD
MKDGPYNNLVQNGVITAFADTSIFSKDAVLKCLYWFGDKFHIQLSLDEGIRYIIILKPMVGANLKEDELENYLKKLERDLVDFQLRDIVNKETQNVRDLLIAKAFSNGEFDEEPPGIATDPIGFDPFLIQQ